MSIRSFVDIRPADPNSAKSRAAAAVVGHRRVVRRVDAEAYLARLANEQDQPAATSR